MPARKLSQADLDDLRDAEAELLRSNPRRIVRRNSHGDIVITTLKQLAAWKDVSESYFYEMKRNGFKLKRGVPYEDRAAETVDANLYHSTVKMFQDWVAALQAELAQCQAELQQLRKDHP